MAFQSGHSVVQLQLDFGTQLLMAEADLEIRDRLGVAFAFEVNGAGQEAGLGAQGGVGAQVGEHLQGGVEMLELVLGLPQVEQRLFIPRLGVQNLLQAGDGLLVLLVVVEAEPQAAVGIQVLGIAAQGGLQVILGLGMIVLQGVQIAEIIVGLEVVFVQGAGDHEAAVGFLEVAGLERGDGVAEGDLLLVQLRGGGAEADAFLVMAQGVRVVLLFEIEIRQRQEGEGIIGVLGQAFVRLPQDAVAVFLLPAAAAGRADSPEQSEAEDAQQEKGEDCGRNEIAAHVVSIIGGRAGFVKFGQCSRGWRAGKKR
jgi:hypothetical protein